MSDKMNMNIRRQGIIYLWSTLSLSLCVHRLTFYKTPFVLTTSPDPTSPAPRREQAVRTATASALNALSARWWSLSPYTHPTCSVTFAACAKLCSPCVIISVLRSPIFSRRKPRLTTAQARLERSMTAHERASSSGASPRPKRVMEARAPRALVNAVPRARKVSSVVWWSSTAFVSDWLLNYVCATQI